MCTLKKTFLLIKNNMSLPNFYIYSSFKSTTKNLNFKIQNYLVQPNVLNYYIFSESSCIITVYIPTHSNKVTMCGQTFLYTS